MMRCLVVGGRGFIGSHLVDALLAQGHFVRCFDRAHVAPLGESHLSNPQFELFEGDLVSEADVAEALIGCDACFHLVSTTLPKSSNADPVFDVESNVLGTVRLLTHAVKAGVRKVIFVSSGGTVYGIPREVPIREDHPTDPICSYGITKLAIEKYLGLFRELHGLDCTVLRLANPFGDRQRTHASQGAVAVFLGKALRGEVIEIWGDGSIVRDYVHIDDVVSALIIALGRRTDEHVFNIGSGKGLSLNDVLDAIESVIGKKTVRNYLPGRAFDVPVSQLCIERARRDLGWEPRVTFADGIRRFAKWVELDELGGSTS
jgi:UDP-glucose 4-epimerase